MTFKNSFVFDISFLLNALKCYFFLIATTTAGAEQGATTTAPLLLTLLFGLFK